MEYLLSAIERTAFEIAILFGGAFALAAAMWFASQRLRGDGYGRFGRRYAFFVAPGVFCHEAGHALGCILTGTRISEFVPFRPSGNELGHVSYERRSSFFGHVADFVIGTGPVWFGCIVILVLARLLGGRGFLEGVEAQSPLRGESISGYLACVLKSALWMLLTVLSPERWGSALFPLCFYLIFCVASEITLSPPDLRLAWRGFASLVALLFLLNLVPVVSSWLCLLVDSLWPSLFVFHTLLAFGLLFDLAILSLAAIAHRLFGT